MSQSSLILPSHLHFEKSLLTSSDQPMTDESDNLAFDFDPLGTSQMLPPLPSLRHDIAGQDSSYDGDEVDWEELSDEALEAFRAAVNFIGKRNGKDDPYLAIITGLRHLKRSCAGLLSAIQKLTRVDEVRKIRKSRLDLSVTSSLADIDEILRAVSYAMAHIHVRDQTKTRHLARRATVFRPLSTIWQARSDSSCQDADTNSSRLTADESTAVDGDWDGASCTVASDEQPSSPSASVDMSLIYSNNDTAWTSYLLVRASQSPPNVCAACLGVAYINVRSLTTVVIMLVVGVLYIRAYPGHFDANIAHGDHPIWESLVRKAA
ncbi:hypothetical protein FKP32DRAFT_1600307 [Trametes sanguinea]|nr:hypothetical protein FKP32DRAFT_1600307 [Trametes sanguinea]